MMFAQYTMTGKMVCLLTFCYHNPAVMVSPIFNWTLPYEAMFAQHTMTGNRLIGRFGSQSFSRLPLS